MADEDVGISNRIVKSLKK